MAHQYLEQSHFKGQLAIEFGNDYNFDGFAEFIEKKYMTKLFGVYLRGTVSLENGATYINDGIYYEHHGTTEMLKYFFFFHYMTEQQSEVARTDKIEEVYSYSVSGQRERMNKNIVNNWNIAVDYYNEIVAYVNYLIDNGSTDYEGFDPETLEKINIFVI